MTITSKQQRQQRHNEAVQQITEDFFEDRDPAADMGDRLHRELLPGKHDELDQRNL